LPAPLPPDIHRNRLPLPAASRNRGARTLALALFLAATLLAAVARAGNAPPSADPAGKRAIVVGGDRAYPPYEFVDQNGQPAGFNVDLTRAIAEVMGMQVTFRFGDWADMRNGLADGTIDILQGISYSRERARSMDFSPPHTIVHHAVFARRDGRPVAALEDLRGKKVIAFRGGIMHERLKRLGFEKDLILTPTPAEVMRLLASGQGDYAVLAMLPGMYMIREHHLSNLTPVAKAVVSEQYCYGVGKGNREILSRFNEGLAIVVKTGQYQAIYNKWLGVHDPPRLNKTQAIRYGATILLPLLAILAATALWSRTLHKRVEARTAELAREVIERNKALEELRRHQDRLIQADKMASLGTLVSGVAHEINNPNGLILLDIPVLKRVHADALEIFADRYRQEGDFMLGGGPLLRDARGDPPHPGRVARLRPAHKKDRQRPQGLRPPRRLRPATAHRPEHGGRDRATPGRPHHPLLHPALLGRLRRKAAADRGEQPADRAGGRQPGFERLPGPFRPAAAGDALHPLRR